MISDSPTRAFDRNIRVSPDRLLDLLFCLTQDRGRGTIQSPPWLLSLSPRVSRNYQDLLLGLDLADSPRPRTFRLLPETAKLRTIWEAGDLDRLSGFLARYQPFAEVLYHDPNTLPNRPVQTVAWVRNLAVLLGQITQVRGRFYKGNENPTPDEVRRAILGHFQRDRPEPSFSMYDLLVGVFLRKLRVSPVRAMAAWDTMEQGGVFEGFEFRTGGSPDTRKNQVVIRLGTDGWRRETVLLDEFQGKRDITEIIAAKITRDSAEREPKVERDDAPPIGEDDIPF